MRRGSAGPGGPAPRATRVDRPLPAPGHPPAGAPVGSTPTAERRKESKRRSAVRTERPSPPGEASTTGAAQRALVLEPGSFRYAYRTGQAARCRDVARSLENRMETTTSVPQTQEDGASSLRTSRTDRSDHGSPGTNVLHPTSSHASRSQRQSLLLRVPTGILSPWHHGTPLLARNERSRIRQRSHLGATIGERQTSDNPCHGSDCNTTDAWNRRLTGMDTRMDATAGKTEAGLSLGHSVVRSIVLRLTQPPVRQ